MPIYESTTRAFRVLLPVSATILAAGCSADVARFDFPSSGFATASNQTNSIPIPPANVYGAPPRAGLLGQGDGASHQPPPMADASGRGGDVRVAELPPTSGNSYGGGSGAGYRDERPSRSYDRASDRGYDQVSAKAYDAAPRARRNEEPRYETASSDKATGESVEVKAGDTLYGLSRRHGVPVDDIMAANDLKGHSLKPGQRLTMPAGGSSKSVAATTSGAPALPAETTAATQAAPASAEPSAVAADAAPAAATGETAGTYTMKAGDSLYTIARQHKVKYADLQQANGITDADVRKIRPGTVLKIPANSVEPKTRASTTLSLSQTGTHLPVPSEAPTAAPSAPAGDGPTVINAPQAPPAAAPSDTAGVGADTKVAALDTKTSTDAVPATVAKPADASASTSASGRLRWPVQGRIISQFGPRPDGTHNDGVNFSVPLGTDVHAAESGEVIYVGNELKAYGKLVLLRHDNGWVTAYAHNDELLVTRGKKVGRGDVIAKAGKTGPVDQPQVHFELRQDSKAVDPTSFMEKQ